MGQSHSQHTHPILDSNWIPINSSSNIFSHVNPYAHRILKNINTQQQIEQYQLDFASQADFRRYAQELRVRMQPNDGGILQQNNPDSYYNLSQYIYTVRYFVNGSAQDMCSTVYKGVLYVEKVDLRLKQINDIPLTDQLYLTRATLQGFKLLYQRVGYFDITEQMIFISKEGRVKVWINPNLSNNQPLHIPNLSSTKDGHGSQSDMIVQLLDLIQQNSDSQQQQAIHFKQYLTKKGIYSRLSFYRALDQFQAYCMEEHLMVENSMKSIYELYYQQPEVSQVELSQRYNKQQSTIQRESSYKIGNAPHPMHIQLPIPQNQSHLLNSRASKQSERQTKSIGAQQRREDTNRARSTNSKAQRPQQVLFNNGNTHLSVYNQQGRISNPVVNRSNHIFVDVVQQRKQVISAMPTATFGLPPNNKQQIPMVEHNGPAVIKFNYVPNQNLTNSRNYPSLPTTNIQHPLTMMAHHIGTVQSIRAQSRGSTKELNQQINQLQFRANSTKKTAATINYYSPHQIYTLDREIAEDLEKYLGYTLNP